MNIAILGGRFDPPHWGHYWVARQILEKGPDITEVWLMPTHRHPWKEAVASPFDRLQMLTYLSDEKIKVSSVEVEKAGVSYTIETIKYLKENYKENKFFWIVGSDAISDFAKWRESQKLSLQIPFLVFPRGGYPVKLLPVGMKKIEGEDAIETNLSSSHIRKRLQQGLTVRGLIPKGVEEYVRKKNLYR